MAVDRASDNPFASILMVEGDPEDLASNPASGQRRLAVGTDHILYLVDDSGVKHQVGDAAGLAAHLADTSAAHAASAISFTPNGSIAATDVQAAIQEVRDEAGASGGIATDTFWGAAGDLAVATGNDAASPLAIGTSGYVLTSNGTTAAWAAVSVTAKRFRLTKNATQSTSSGTPVALTWPTEDYDSANMHFTSTANLTGTVTKTASSTTLTGSSTLFTSELTVGQVISVPGTAAEVRMVSAIASDTSLTVSRAFANSASGQTAARKSEYIGFTVAENWHFSGSVEWATNTSGERSVFLELTQASGGASIAVATARQAPGATSGESVIAFAGDWTVAVGDIIALSAYQNATTLNVATTRTVLCGHTY